MSDTTPKLGPDLESGEHPKNSLYDAFVAEFHPIWNVAFMATGISACILYNFAYPARWLEICSYVMWAISLIIFFTVTALTPWRLFTDSSWELFNSPQLNIFLGPYSMGFSTIVNMVHFISADRWGVGTFVLWWINVALALAISWGVLYKLFSRANIDHTALSAALILPVLPMSVCASSGALIVPNLPNARLKLLAIVVSLILWSMAVFIGCAFICILFWKLLTSSLPPKHATFSLFAPMGLIGHASWGILLQGINARNYVWDYTDFPEKTVLGRVLHFITFPVGVFFLSIGFFLTFLAFFVWFRRGWIPFSRMWWPMPFPIGAMSLGLREMYTAFDMETFRVLSAIYGVLCILVVIFSLAGSALYEFPRRR